MQGDGLRARARGLCFLHNNQNFRDLGNDMCVKTSGDETEGKPGGNFAKRPPCRPTAEADKQHSTLLVPERKLPRQVRKNYLPVHGNNNNNKKPPVHLHFTSTHLPPGFALIETSPPPPPQPPPSPVAATPSAFPNPLPAPPFLPPLPSLTPPSTNDPRELKDSDALAIAAPAAAWSSLTATKSNPHRLKRLRVANQGSLTSGGEEAFMRGCGKNLIHSRISTCSARDGTRVRGGDC